MRENRRLKNKDSNNEMKQCQTSSNELCDFSAVFHFLNKLFKVFVFLEYLWLPFFGREEGEYGVSLFSSAYITSFTSIL